MPNGLPEGWELTWDGDGESLYRLRHDGALVAAVSAGYNDWSARLTIEGQTRWAWSAPLRRDVVAKVIAHLDPFDSPGGAEERASALAVVGAELLARVAELELAPAVVALFGEGDDLGVVEDAIAGRLMAGGLVDEDQAPSVAVEATAGIFNSPEVRELAGRFATQAAELEAVQGSRVREFTALTRDTGLLRDQAADLKRQADGLMAQMEAEMQRQAARADAAEAQVRAVRELHRCRHEPHRDQRWCIHCSTGLDDEGRTTGGSLVRWPCATLRALDDVGTPAAFRPEANDLNTPPGNSASPEPPPGVTDAMVEAAWSAYWPIDPGSPHRSDDDRMRAAIAAALTVGVTSNPPARLEPAGEVVTPLGPDIRIDWAAVKPGQTYHVTATVDTLPPGGPAIRDVTFTEAGADV